MGGGVSYWLAEHPAIVGFRWSHAHSWGATWPFLLSSLLLHLLLLRPLLLLLRRHCSSKPFPLHSLLMSLLSAALFSGSLLSCAAEIRDSLWLWRRPSAATSPILWLLCFPPGTRPSGRVFFWSYAFYLSRLLAMLLRPSAAAPLARPSAVIAAFLWLEFAQSFQVPAILATTGVEAVVHACRFLDGVGVRRGRWEEVVAGCRVALVAAQVVLHLGVAVAARVGKGGCSGIGAWGFNAVLNGVLLAGFVHRYLKWTPPAKKGSK